MHDALACARACGVRGPARRWLTLTADAPGRDAELTRWRPQPARAQRGRLGTGRCVTADGAKFNAAWAKLAYVEYSILVRRRGNLDRWEDCVVSHGLAVLNTYQEQLPKTRIILYKYA